MSVTSVESLILFTDKHSKPQCYTIFIEKTYSPHKGVARNLGGGFYYQGCTPYDSYDVTNKWLPTDRWGLVRNCLPLNETLSAN